MDKIYELLKKVNEDYDYRNSNDYIADGFLDSMDVMLLILIIEEEYSIKINGLDIRPENFKSVASIMDLIIRNGGIIQH